MEKYIIWLGIRSYQDEQEAIYNACRQLDLSVVLIAPSCPALLEDKVIFHRADLNDEQAVLDLVTKIQKNHHCVLSLSWTDPPVELNAKASALLGTPGPSIDAATRARNKYEMVKAVWKTYPEYVPAFKVVKETDDFNGVAYPCIIKPISASGSKGIYIAHNREKAEESLQQLNKLATEGVDSTAYNRHGHKFLCESYVSGQEFSVEGVVVNNACCIAGVTEKTVTEPWFAERQHVFPAHFNKEVMAEIHHATKCVIQALGLNNAPFHLEAKWSEDGFKLIEIAARIGGDLISTHLISLATQSDWLIRVIQSLIDQTPAALSDPVRHAGIRFQFANRSGLLNGYELPEDSDSTLYSHSASIAKLNTLIKLPPEDFSSFRVGYSVVAAESRKELEDLLETRSSRTVITIA